jgi:tetratricopeptide (TPR) repeat protein
MYEKAIEIDPSFALAWTHVAEVCYFYGQDKVTGAQFREKGERALDRALTLEPDQIEARLARAFQMVDNEGRVEEAIPDLRSIIETNDNNAFAHWFLSQAYRYGGMLQESIAEGERALQIDPDVMRDTSFNSLLYAGQYDRFLSSMALKPEGARTISIGASVIFTWATASRRLRNLRVPTRSIQHILMPLSARQSIPH